MAKIILPKKGITKIYRAEFQAWCDMKNRCYNENLPCWERYGGRGIRVCNRWIMSFRDFLTDMKPRPSNKHSLDRIDNNGHYTPKNCRWATRPTQQRNKRNSHILTFNGQTKSVHEWAEEFGINVNTIIVRLQRGWTVDKTLAGKAWMCPRKGSLTHTINGITKTVRKWSIELGINPDAVYIRIQKGWSIKDALTVPMRKCRRK